MRITIINQFYVPDISPTAHLSASLAEYLAQAGHEVTVVTSRGGYVRESKDGDTAADANPRVYRAWTPKLGKGSIIKRCIDYGIFYVLAFWRMMRLPQQDVVISLTTPPYIAWAGAAHKILHRKTKLLIWNMDCYPDAAERLGALKPGGLAARFMRMMNRALFRRLDHLICLDTAMVDLLISQYGPKDGTLSTTVIPNWEKAAMFPVCAKPQPWSHAEELGLVGQFVVLYLGNTGYGHMFETVIEAAKQLRDEPVKFLFVGGGSRWSQLEQAKADNKLENLILHGYVPKEETPRVMAAASCALITLRDIALGVMSPSKMHANLAAGLPILYIGPKKSNVDDAITNYGCGISVRANDVDGVVTYIRAMMADKECYADMRTKARRAFDEAYCDERTLPQFERVLKTVARVNV